MKPLNKFLEIFKGDDDDRNLAIVNDSQEKHICNDE